MLFFLIWYTLGFLGIIFSLVYNKQDLAETWEADKWVILFVSILGVINLVVFLLDWLSDIWFSDKS